MNVRTIGHAGWRFALSAAVMAGGLAVAPAAPAVAQSAGCPAVVVPAYFDNDALWAEMIAASRVDIVIVNPASGVGGKRDPVIAQRVAVAQAKGIRVLGYVKTNLTKRKARTVRREIARYWSWYGVDGIFLDQAQTEMRYLKYYKGLSDYIRKNGDDDQGFVMLNPGATPAPAYLDIADVVVNYEYFHSRYARQEFPDWVQDRAADDFAQIVHDVPAAALESTLDEARANNAGYVFLTDRDDPNQYRGLPSFWNDKLRELCG